MQRSCKGRRGPWGIDAAAELLPKRGQCSNSVKPARTDHRPPTGQRFRRATSRRSMSFAGAHVMPHRPKTAPTPRQPQPDAGSKSREAARQIVRASKLPTATTSTRRDGGLFIVASARSENLVAGTVHDGFWCRQPNRPIFQQTLKAADHSSRSRNESLRLRG